MFLDIEVADPGHRARVRRFLQLAEQEPATAVAWWRGVSQSMDGMTRETANRLVAPRLNARQRRALAGTAAGTSLMLEWQMDRDRRPRLPRLPFLSQALAHDYCTSLVQQRATMHACQALSQGFPVILALRQDTWTLSNRGRGAYDDRFFVLNGWSRRGSLSAFPACTEPGAQYAHRGAPGPAGERIDPRYVDVKFKKSDGVDVNGDGILDAGRLRQGTYFFKEKPAGFLKDRAFQATATQTVERDTDGDGFFTLSDPARIDARGVGRSMYIHQGGPTAAPVINTWSAGCQTVPRDVYHRFLASLGPRPAFFYVLVDCR